VGAQRAYSLVYRNQGVVGWMSIGCPGCQGALGARVLSVPVWRVPEGSMYLERPIEFAVGRAHRAARFDVEQRDEEGNTAPESAFPPCFSSVEGPKVCDQGMGRGPPRRGNYCCEEAYDPLRGSILTRVPPSSIDRSAPRSRSSWCASRAVATMLTAPSESRSWRSPDRW
jgi:hypothetical protein